MSPRLNDALHELAEGAPREVNADRVLARARRRRRVRLIAVPSVAAAAAAAILLGATLIAGGTEPAKPIERPAPPIVTKPGKILNPPGVLPGPLPSGKVEPIVFGFLDHCRKQGLQETTRVSGDCAQWRLVGRSGKQWRLADGIGSMAVKPDDYMNGDAGMAISPDGLHLAYYRATDRRVVIRDLTTGRITPIGRTTAPQMPTTSASLLFSNDGKRLAITSGEPGRRRTLLADVSTGALTALPDGDLIGFDQDASTIVLGNVWSRKEPLVFARPDGAVRARVSLDSKVNLRGASGNLLSPDGRTLVTPSRGLDKAMLVDAHTGKVTSVRPVRGGVGDVLAWAGPTKYFSVRSPSGHFEPRGTNEIPTREQRCAIVDLTTGMYAYRGPTFKIQAWQSTVAFGGFFS
ncbi:WD40 repeat domain-containing protein [Actinomadura violacea]|uniref:PD40 domain-containing protein n=1 Tax=Actinomadura violacea TaxID=2819934 RepID=A0ABS3S4I2_9ACTN|nr:PD40 domain-containing protein [Actinomadura violacea]MBO2463895.1 PD40 domain-containing protein [Actinomadura violacea]